MWQKTYRMDAGPQIPPRQAIATWREHFPEFWQKGNRFAGALTGIKPGDVALLDLAIGGGSSCLPASSSCTPTPSRSP